MEAYPDVCVETNSMKVCKKKGMNDRLAVANRNIDKHTVVFKSEAYYTVLNREHQMSRCSNCHIPNPTKRCSKCSIAQYCSEQCQHHDFFAGNHRKECGNLKRLMGLLVDPYLSETRLLLRTITSNVSNKKKEMLCSTNSDDVTSCGTSHYSKLSTECIFNPNLGSNQGLIRFLREHNLVPPSIDNNEIIAAIKSLRTNSFGLFSDVFFIIGSGIFPQAALLNHSCEPNVVLLYWYRLKDKLPPLCVGVASRAIAEDEELTHSYVDACLPLSLRRAQLLESRGFLCKCQRCLMQEQSHNTFFSFTTSESDLIEELKRHFGDPLRLKDTLAGAEGRARLPAIVERLLTDEGSCYRIESYTNNCTSLENSMQETVDLMSTEDGTAATESKNRSIFLLKQVASFLIVALCHIPMHPLVPVQLFTLADLLESNGKEDKEESKLYYRWCKEVLSITHPPNISGSTLFEQLDHQL